ncbi:hypothetical protein DFJ73DRAFT_924784, partial [Zopfochytrium polystomum]
GLQPRLASSAVSLSQSTPRLLERPTLLHTSQPHLESSHQGRSSSPVGGEVSLLATGSSVGGSSGPLAMVSRQGSFILIGDSLRATAEAVTRKAARNRRSVDGEQFRSLVALAPVTVDETGKATVDAAFARTPEGGTLLAGRRGVSPGMAGRRGDGNQERELDTIMTHARVVRNLDEVFVSQLIDERTAKMNVQNIKARNMHKGILHNIWALPVEQSRSCQDTAQGEAIECHSGKHKGFLVSLSLSLCGYKEGQFDPTEAFRTDFAGCYGN